MSTPLLKVHRIWIIALCASGTNFQWRRFRPMWDNWSTSITVEYDKNVFGRIEDVTNLVQTAGFYVGVCEGRPERSSLGWGSLDLCR